jgi:hypothetical protein
VHWSGYDVTALDMEGCVRGGRRIVEDMCYDEPRLVWTRLGGHVLTVCVYY